MLEMIMGAAEWKTHAVRVIFTVAALSSSLIIALLTRGRKKLGDLQGNESVLFRVWPGFYVLGGVMVAAGILTCVFALLADLGRPWIVFLAGVFFFGLGVFNIHSTRTGYVLVSRERVEVKDTWKIFRFSFADMERPRRAGQGFVLKSRSKNLYLIMMYTNSRAMLQLLQQRWAEAHPQSADM